MWMLIGAVVFWVVVVASVVVMGVQGVRVALKARGVLHRMEETRGLSGPVLWRTRHLASQAAEDAQRARTIPAMARGATLRARAVRDELQSMNAALRFEVLRLSSAWRELADELSAARAELPRLRRRRRPGLRLEPHPCGVPPIEREQRERRAG